MPFRHQFRAIKRALIPYTGDPANDKVVLATAERPKLQQALEHCELTGATLVVAKLDRLSRNVAFLMQLRDSGVDFVAAGAVPRR